MNVISKSYVNPFPNKPWFLRVCSGSLLKTPREKEKLIVTSNFSFPTVFSTHLENFLPFLSNSILSSATPSVWKSLKFVVWERVKLPRLSDLDVNFVFKIQPKMRGMGQIFTFRSCSEPMNQPI